MKKYDPCISKRCCGQCLGFQKFHKTTLSCKPLCSLSCQALLLC